jgi:hypothetical protein
VNASRRFRRSHRPGGVAEHLGSGGTPESATFLGRVSNWPTLRIEADGRRITMRSTGDDRVVGRLEPKTGRLDVEVPAEVAAELVRAHPELRRRPGGVRAQLGEPGGIERGEQLMLRRITVARNAAQMRNASP